MSDFPKNEDYCKEPDRLLQDLNPLLLERERDVPQLLVAAINQNFDQYGIVLKLTRRLNRLGAYSALSSLVEKGLQRFPNSIDLAAILADAHFALGQATNLKHLVGLTEKTGRKRSLAAEKLLRLGDVGRALELLSAPEMNGEHAIEDLITRERIARVTGKTALADEALYELTDENARDEAAQRGALQAIWLQNGPIAAKNFFDQIPGFADELAPDLLRILIQGNPSIAQEFFAERGGAKTFGWQLNCRMLLLNGELKTAYEQCRQQIEQRSISTRTENESALLAQIALELGLNEAAADVLEDVLCLFPTSQRLIHFAGQLRFRQGDWKAAEAFLRSASDRYPNSFAALNNYRNMLLQTGKYKEAFDLRTEPTNPARREAEQMFRLRLARSSGDLLEIQTISGAVRAGSYAAKEKALIALLETMVLQGELKRAFELSAAALEKYPSSTEMHILTGKIAFLSGEIEQAKDIRARYHALSPLDDPVADTPDLVLQLASSAGPSDAASPNLELEAMLSKTPVPDSQTFWMQLMYRWMVSKAGAEETRSDAVIPSILLSYWEGELSEPVETIISEWKALLPDFKHYHFDLNSALSWLADNELSTFIELMENARSPATRADIFRLAFLSKSGGLYVDTDERPLCKIDDWLQDCDLLLVAEKGHFTLANSFVACRPNHPVIHACLQHILEHGANFRGGLATWIETGPGLLTAKAGAYIQGQSKLGPVDGLRILMPQEYASRVATTLKLPHKFDGVHWRTE